MLLRNSRVDYFCMITSFPYPNNYEQSVYGYLLIRAFEIVVNIRIKVKETTSRRKSMLQTIISFFRLSHGVK